MEGSGVVGMLLILMFIVALAGALTYLFLSFRDHKAAMEKEVKDAQSAADAAKKAAADESVNRLGNIKFVVDQVNDINEDIYHASMSNNDALRQYVASSNEVLRQYTLSNANSINRLSSSNEALIRGVDTFFRFSTSTAEDRSVFSAASLAPADAPKLKLMKEVSIISGMTARDLKKPSTGSTGVPTGVMAKFCGATTDTAAPCISFPDKDGNTYLTALEAGGQIVLDAPVQVKNNLNAGNVSVSNIVIKNGSQTASINLDGQGKLTVTAASVEFKNPAGTSLGTLQQPPSTTTTTTTTAQAPPPSV